MKKLLNIISEIILFPFRFVGFPPFRWYYRKIKINCLFTDKCKKVIFNQHLDALGINFKLTNKNLLKGHWFSGYTRGLITSLLAEKGLLKKDTEIDTTISIVIDRIDKNWFTEGSLQKAVNSSLKDLENCLEAKNYTKDFKDYQNGYSAGQSDALLIEKNSEEICSLKDYLLTK